MRVLHITNWYQSTREPKKVPFVKEHFEALNNYCDNDLVHVEVVATESSLKYKRYKLSDTEEAFIIFIPINRGMIIEKLTWFLLKKVLSEYKVNVRYDIVNFVIAYPLCVYARKLRAVLQIPFVITEHWTAYYFNFNLPTETTRLDRIKRIFHSSIPLITVSKALGRDIEKFSGRSGQYIQVVPNVVNEVFNYKPEVGDVGDSDGPIFFMVNLWRSIKSPFVVFKAFVNVLITYPGAQLRVGGYGPLWPRMERYVRENNLERCIQLLGPLNKTEIAIEMNRATAFVHAATYETFSVVTAEAIACGTPVVVSSLPAIREFISHQDGLLVESNDNLSLWTEAMLQIYQKRHEYNRPEISERALQKFSKKAVGKKYYEAFKNILSLD